MEKDNIIWPSMSDAAFMEQIGAFIKTQRLNQNKTQNQLADDAGINRSTLVDFEQGRGGNLLTFIQLLRALDLLHLFEEFKVKQQISPLQLAEMQQKYQKRKRASKSGDNKKPKSDW